MEVVKLRSLYGIAKVVGIILSLGGAATIALYKGPHLKPFNHHHPFGNDTVGAHHAHSSKSWIEGSFIMLAGNILWGLWLVMQVHDVNMMLLYPFFVLLLFEDSSSSTSTIT